MRAYTRKARFGLDWKEDAVRVIPREKSVKDSAKKLGGTHAA